METVLFIVFSVFSAIGLLYVVMFISEWFVFGDKETILCAKVEIHMRGGGMFCPALVRGLIEFLGRVNTGCGQPQIVLVDDGLTPQNRQELAYITDGLDFVHLERGAGVGQGVENGTGEDLA